MSDLPPSTVPDDEHQGTSRVDPEEQHVADEDQTEEEELKHEDQKETDDGITENKEQDEGSVEQNEDLESPDNTGQDVESQGDDEESGDEDDEDDSQIDEPAKNQDEIETETEKVIQEEENDGNGDNDNNGSKTEEEDDDGDEEEDDEEEDDDDDEEDEEDTDGEVDKTDEGKSASVDGENEKEDVKDDNNTSHVEQTNTDEQKPADSGDEAEDSEDEAEDREDEPEDREEEAEDREEEAENRDDEPEDKADKQEDETDDNEDQEEEDERVVNNEQEQVHANITSDDNQQSDKEEEHQEQVEQDTHTRQEDEQETAEKTDDDHAEENRDKNPSDDVTDTNLVIVPPPVKVGSDKDEPAEQPGESIEKDKNKEKENDELEEDDTKERKTHQRTQSSDDDTTREYNKIGGKKVKDNQTKISLTTVLVSRDEDEKKRMKNRSKSKSQKMRKLARKKTKKFGTKGEKGDEFVMDDEEYMYSSEDETKPIGERSAPFIEQYNNKKRIEHILEQQHYWSDEEGDKESFGVHVNLISVFGSTQSDSESDYEELTGPDGVVHRVKRSHGRDEIEQLNDDYTGTKRTKSFDSLASVEDPESPKGHVSKKRLNEHDIQNDRAFDRTEVEEPGKSKDDETTETDDKQSKARIIYVEKKDIDKKQARNKVKMNVSQRTSDGSDVASDTDMDRLSERDSCLDEELDGAVDVVLNKDQQAMIVDMLFDKEMNLRPQFARDGDGRIIRRLDNTVIYDPHSGRFTFHKKFGKIFNVPRLRRNRKGRPTGGYVDDPFGPHESEIQTRTPSSKLLRRSASGKSTRSRVTSITESPSPEMKRPRGDGKLVGFMMPDDDIESLTADQLDIHKRGRRDIGSALRRKLNKRLFRKKRNVAPISTFLPDITMKRALTHDGMTNGQETTVGPRGVSSLNVPLSRSGPAFGTPGTHRRPLGTANADQKQMYRQGLERDKRILEERQDGLNKKPFEAFGPNDGQENIGDNSDEDETEDGEYGEQKPAFYTSQSFYTDGGRLVVRERGCPELHRPATLFTIVRRQEDLERERTAEIVDDNSNINRNCKSAPSLTKSLDDHDFHREAEREMTCHGTRHNGSGSQLSGIDNNRLRRLLEELYKDKKYFDQYIEAQEPDSEEFIHSKGLAEHGRGYLLERAEYWDRRGPLPPKPHMTDIGWKMHRQQTMMESRINTDRSSTMSNMTATEEQHTGTIPGVVDSMEGGEANTNDNDNKDISKD